MSMTTNLPRGCSAMRGTSDIGRTPSRGGGRAHQTNKLYMLNVRRESLTNKKRTLENQLRAIKDQLQGIDTDIRETERKYKRLKGRRRTTDGNNGQGRAIKRMRLTF